MKKALIVSAKANMIKQFNQPNIKLLIEMGYEVTVATNFKEPGTIPAKESKDFINKLLELNVTPVDINFQRNPISLQNIKAYMSLKDIIYKGKFDLIHCHSPVGGAFTRWAARNIEQKNTRVLYTAHGFHFYKGAPLINWFVFYPIERLLSNYTDTIITINQEDYKRAQIFKAKHVEYIPGVGIDLDSIQVNKEKVSKLKKGLEFSTDDFVLCSIGELNDNKNHSVVLEALSKVNNKNIKYIVAGTGELKDDLAKKTKELNLEDQVTFLGFRDDIYELLSLSDVFVFPSFREGLSKSLMEAMAVGKPVIASNIRGNKDLINNDEGGLLFDPKDAIQLSESIMKMLNDESFRNNASAINMKKIKQFSLDNILERMSEIYQ